ncbi:MAG: DNA photolyase [Deltaproteobacteria bacterium]|nr:MAG: DNA photolyase [Deltaproteobacteria bacterium]
MKKFKLRRILIERGAEDDTLAKKMLKGLPDIPREAVEPDDLAQREDIEGMDKETLRIIHFNGEFLKPCPGTRGYICCGYQILNIGINCPMECSYCFLQSYINQPSLRLFTNLEDRLNVIGKIIDSSPDRIFRIGTGEFTDSLCLDYLTGWTDLLLPFFSRRRNCVLELKTKSASIEFLIKSSYRKGIVIAWSLNTPRIIANEEQGTADLKSRILAARECQKAGFVLGFHFDPLIHYPGWAEDSEETVGLLERYIDPGYIVWMSVGSFRYVPDLKWTVKRRFPGTDIFDGEFVPGLDGKFRYFKPIRVEMYTKLSERLRKWYDDLGLYLCMESDDVWTQSLGWSPRNSTNLTNYLDNRARKLMAN